MSLRSIRDRLVAGDHVTVSATSLQCDELRIAILFANASNGHLVVTGCGGLDHGSFAEVAQVATDPARTTIKFD